MYKPWWRRANIVYGFCAGGIVTGVGILGLLMIKFDLTRFEQAPPESVQTGLPTEGTTMAPIVRDHLAAVEENQKSSSREQKIAPTGRLGASQPHQIKASPITTATEPATEPITPAPAPVPSESPAPVVVTVPKPTAPPVLPLPVPDVNVSVPPLLRVSTGK